MMNQFEEINIESALNTLKKAIVTIHDASQKNSALSALEVEEAQLNLTKNNAPFYEADDGEISDEYRQAIMVFVEQNYPIKGNLRLEGSLLHDLYISCSHCEQFENPKNSG